MHFIFISFETHKHLFSESLIEDFGLLNENRFRLLYWITFLARKYNFYDSKIIRGNVCYVKVTWKVIYLVNNSETGFRLNRNLSICYYFFGWNMFDDIILHAYNLCWVLDFCCMYAWYHFNFKFIIKNISYKKCFITHTS